MTDRPILFSAPMIRALFAGRKTQTRRVLTAACDEPPAFVLDGVVTALDENDRPYPWPGKAARRDRLWVREAWWHHKAAEIEQAGFSGATVTLLDKGPSAVHPNPEFDPAKYPRVWRARPSIHMPRWASRLTLTVTDVRVQRLQEITEADAIAEGVMASAPLPGDPDPDWSTVRGADENYALLWDDLNAKRAPWASNPWIVALTFTVEHRNIDA
jgi:hypothetical protein